MGRGKRWPIVLLLLLLLLGFLWWRFSRLQKPETLPPPPVMPSSVTTVTPLPEPPKPTPAVRPKPAPTTSTGAPVAPKVKLHKELIPKNIEIVRCYYAAEVIPPGATLGFDINGSGFTSEFEKMIRVDAGHEHVSVKNLLLVTANQIHGEIVAGERAKTGFVFPRVLIKGLPVFSAPEPFAIVRKGEVLTVFFTSMQENGRGGKFRVITHLDEKMAKTFRIEPSTPGIVVSEIEPELPYLVHGSMQITPGVPPGDHGLTMSIHGKEVFKRMGMIRIVRPNVGQLGFIQNLSAEERYHRPGDMIQIYVQGTGLSAEDAPKLRAKVEEFNLGQGSFTYLSPFQIRLALQSLTTMPLKSYSVKIQNESGTELFEKKNLFELVPPNWVKGVQVSPPLKAGGKSLLRVIGRDLTEDFATAFRIEVDESGITLGPIQRESATTLSADIMASDGVAPGDYWLHLSAHHAKISPPFGSIIKVEASH